MPVFLEAEITKVEPRGTYTFQINHSREVKKNATLLILVS